MDIEYEGDKMDELLRLAKDNNRMLHTQRRNAWVGGIFRMLVWGAVIVVPIWFYMQYMAPIVDSMLETYKQMQGTSAQVQAQFSGLQEALQKFQSMTGGGTKSQ